MTCPVSKLTNSKILNAQFSRSYDNHFEALVQKVTTLAPTKTPARGFKTISRAIRSCSRGMSSLIQFPSFQDDLEYSYDMNILMVQRIPIVITTAASVQEAGCNPAWSTTQHGTSEPLTSYLLDAVLYTCVKLQARNRLMRAKNK